MTRGDREITLSRIRELTSTIEKESDREAMLNTTKVQSIEDLVKRRSILMWSILTKATVKNE